MIKLNGKFFCLFLMFFASGILMGKAGGVKGIIYDEAGNSLPYASIYVKENGLGSASNLDGFYEIDLTPGTYTIAEQMQAGWYAVTAQSQQVTLAATGSCHVVTFKNRQGTAIDPPGACRTWYKVCWGDTLYSISRRYGTTVNALKRANGLTCNTI